jgi:hypothetical protein
VLQVQDDDFNISLLIWTHAVPEDGLPHEPQPMDLQQRHGEKMSGALEEFFAGVGEEFGIDMSGGRDMLKTPGDVIEYIVAETSPTDGMNSEEHRDYVAAVLGELMAQALGVTRYNDDSRFLQDLHLR